MFHGEGGVSVLYSLIFIPAPLSIEEERFLFLFSFDWWRRQWHPTPVLLPGKSHGRRSLIVWSPWVCEESDMTEWLHFHFSLSCVGEGNGNPLQCSCLENPRDGGAWWAAVYGVAQSQTWLKRFSSSSSSFDWKCHGICTWGNFFIYKADFIVMGVQGAANYIWAQEIPAFSHLLYLQDT